MALINSELTTAAQKSIDGKKFKLSGVQHVPYDTPADVLATIVSTRRHIGQEFEVIDGEGISTYHFVGGIADGDLVKVDAGAGGTSQRFGIEDNTGIQNRYNNLGDFNMDLVSGDPTYANAMSEFLIAPSNVYLYSQPDGGSSYNQVIANNSGVRLVANTSPQTTIATLDVRPSGDIAAIASNSFTISRGGATAQNVATSVNGNFADVTGNIAIPSGTATLVDGTVTVSSTLVKTGAKILVSADTPSGTQGFLSAPVASIIDSTSFVINSSSAADNSTVNYMIINP